MAATDFVVSRCTNCGQEYEAALAMRECRACYQPLGYWCKRDSEATGSWLPGPVCAHCEKREERNRRRREQRRRKKDSTASEPSLFDSASAAGNSHAGDNGRGGVTGETARQPPAPPAPPAHIATVHAVGVVRRCTNCGTEYAPAAETIECHVCFTSLGWWCRTHSPAGGAWLSGESCPLCLSAPPPLPSRSRPPILPETALRPPNASEGAPAPARPEAYPGPAAKALAFIYAVVFLMALVNTEILEPDGKLLTGAVGAVAAAVAFRLKAKPVLVVLGTVCAAVGTLWISSRDPLAAVVFAMASLATARLRRGRLLAVTTCYLAVLYAFIGQPFLSFLGVSLPHKPLHVEAPSAPRPPVEVPVLPAEFPDYDSSASGAHSDTGKLPTRVSSPRIFSGHMGPVYAVTYTPGAKSVLSLSHDNTLRTWEADSGQVNQELPMSPATAALLYRYSPEGDLLAEVRAVNPHSVLIWNSRTHHLVHTFVLSSPASSLGFSPTGVTLAVGTATGEVEVFDLTAGRKVHHLERTVGGPVTAVDVAGPRPLLAAAGPRGIAIWNTSTLREKNGQPVVRLRGAGSNQAVAVRFTPSGRTLMVVGVENNVSADLSVRYWDTSSGILVKSLPTQKTFPTAACAIRPDGRQFVCASRPDLPGDSKAYVYNLTGP